MILKIYERAKEIISRPIKHKGMKVEYVSPKTDCDADRWGDTRICELEILSREKNNE